jgi:hypothetical protein
MVPTPELTKKQIERDNFLRALSARPQLAMDHFQNLRPGEGVVLVTYMTGYYGIDFAQLFFQRATHRHPDTGDITITNKLTADQVAARGFRRMRGADLGGVDVWVHPSGSEIWLLSSPKLPLPPLPEDPAITEARGYANVHTDEFRDLQKLSSQVKAHIGIPDYAQWFDQLNQAYNKWNQDTARDKQIADESLKPAVEASDQQKVQDEIDRMDQLQTRVSAEIFQGKDNEGDYSLGPAGQIQF